MTQKSSSFKYLYAFNYEYHHSDLCKLESRQLFHSEEKDKLLLTDIKIDPSISPFIKNRFEIILTAKSYSQFIQNIKERDMHVPGFKVEYLLLKGDPADYTERRKKMKDVGYCIFGEPDFENPSITYSICTYEGLWYFGILTKPSIHWHSHKKKPRSFSNSIGMNIAKTLVSMASKGDKSKSLLDACCGVGTVMLEGCSSGFNIEGCDINLHACNHTKANLEHYNYSAPVFCSDIKDITKNYDAIIVDLPYNLYSYSDDNIILNILKSTIKRTDRVVIVSLSKIESKLTALGLEIIDSCTVGKRGKSTFERKIWVCKKE